MRLGGRLGGRFVGVEYGMDEDVEWWMGKGGRHVDDDNVDG